jgi:predicted DNA-binding protein (MmcQ/YjbR family)
MYAFIRYSHYFYGMNIEAFQSYCLSKKGVEESFPFDEVTLVFKVVGKIFAITGLDSPDFSVALKCDPEKAEALREQYPDITPGYHLNKKHWNTVRFDTGMPKVLLLDLIDHSYALVVQGLPKKMRQALEES